MKQYVIDFFGSSGDGMVSYDNLPCLSLDMAMTFTSEYEAEKQRELLRKSWPFAELKVREVEFD